MLTKDVSRKLKVTRLADKSKTAIFKTNELINKLKTLSRDKDIDRLDKQFIDNLIDHLEQFVEYVNVMVDKASEVEQVETKRVNEIIGEYGNIIASTVHFREKPPSFDRMIDRIHEHTTVNIISSDDNTPHRIAAFCFGEMPITIDSRDMLANGFTIEYSHLSHTTTIDAATMKAIDDKWIEYLDETFGKISNVNHLNFRVDTDRPTDLERYKKELKVFYSLLPCNVS